MYAIAHVRCRPQVERRVARTARVRTVAPLTEPLQTPAASARLSDPPPPPPRRPAPRLAAAAAAVAEALPTPLAAEVTVGDTREEAAAEAAEQQQEEEAEAAEEALLLELDAVAPARTHAYSLFRAPPPPTRAAPRRPGLDAPAALSAAPP